VAALDFVSLEHALKIEEMDKTNVKYKFPYSHEATKKLSESFVAE
jgi:hypothetical protein